jgi:Tetratricopeptide repeat/Bacterial SH3 domain
VVSGRRCSILPALILLAAGLAGRAASADTPEQTFDRACHAYEQGRWDEAAETYRALLRYGFADPRLEYDLGNAEFKRGKLGEAILHYERARRLDPADRDILHNLALVRGRIRDVVDDPDATGPMAVLHAVQDRAGSGGQAVAFLVAVWLVGGIVTWCGARPGGFTPGWGWALAGVVLAAALTFLSWRSTDARLTGTPRAVVLKPSVEALAGPGLSNASLFTLHEGTTVEIASEREGWLQVALPNGLSGWVARDDAERI